MLPKGVQLDAYFIGQLSFLNSLYLQKIFYNDKFIVDYIMK